MNQTTFKESIRLLANYRYNKSKLILIMALFGTMLLNAQTSTPWFEGLSTTSWPTGWQQTNFSISSSIANINYANPTTASGNYIYKNIYGTGNNATGEIKTPSVGPILEGEKLQFIHKIVNWDSEDETISPGQGSGDFKVMISNDDGLTYTTVSTIVNGDVANWIDYEFDLGDYVGDTILVKIKADLLIAGSDYYMAFDNFQISSGLCELPGFPSQVANTVSTIDLSIAGNSTYDFQVQYGPVGFALGSGIVSAESVDNVLQISGLINSTEYNYYVRRVCDDSESPWIGPYKMFSQCAILNTVFTQNFDSTATGSATNPSPPLCWSYIGPEYVSWNSGIGYTYQYTLNPLNKVFYIYNNADIENNFILVSPETENLGNGTKRLRFDAWSSFGGANLIVGTMTNPTDPTTFVPLPVGTFELNNVISEKTVTLPAGTADYFAFKLDNGLAYKTIYIDNVSFENIPICQDVDFGTALVSNVLASQTSLSWESNATVFDIKYGPAGFNFETEGILISDVTATSYLLANLVPATNYSYYVRSNCAADGQGTWRGPINFTTQTIKTSPWFDGFADGVAPGWNNLIGNFFILNNSSNALSPLQNYAIAANIFNTNHVGAGITTPNIGPVLEGDQFTFDYKIVMFSSPYGPVDSSAGSIDVLISTDFGQTYEILETLEYGVSSEWESFQMSLTDYVGELVKIKLAVNYNYLPWPENYDHFVAFDNFYIGSCSLPAIPELISVTTSSVTISIAGEATNVYEIEYGLEGFVQGEGNVVEVTGNLFTIENLELGSIYQYYIKQICDEDTSSPQMGRFKFITACDIFDTINETFAGPDVVETNDSISFPLCWSVIAEGQGVAIVDTIDNQFYFYNSSSNGEGLFLISPETDNLGNGLSLLKFKARTSTWSPGNLVIGTMSNSLDASTFVGLQTITPTTTLTEYQVYLPEGTADYFALKAGTSFGEVIVDDVFLVPLPSCVEPIEIVVNSNFPQSTALVSWISPSILTSHNFEIEYGITGFTQGEGTTVEVTGTSYLLDNLIDATNYSVYVRRICDDENSGWVGPFNFLHDYCLSGASSVDGNGITSVTMAGTTLEVTTPEQAPYYVNLIDQPIAFVAGETINFELVFETGYTYDTHIWIDLNKDGVFDNETEKVYTGVSTGANPTTLTGTFVVSNLGDNLTGDYRVRISGADGGQFTPNPCYVGSWGETIDLMATITFPCLTPTDISFTDVGFDYAVIDWEGQGTTNFVLEYGLTGFTQGQGTVIENVTKPYTLEGLTSGATYDFYVRKQCAAVYSDWSTVASTYIYCDTPEPTGAANQTLVEDELLSDLVINGQNLKYYADPGLTIELPASTVLYSSGTYFVTQTIGCESDSSFIVNVTILPRINEPGVNPTQNFCDGGNLSDIVVSSLPSATVIWYQTLTSTEALPLSTPLVTGTYYVVQTDGITTSHRVVVNVTVNPTPPNLVPQPVHLCGNFTFGNLTINSLPGAEVKWYASMTATNSIASNVPVATGTYYVTQNFGACESQRVAYQVDQFEALGTPVAAIQTFCGTGTVGELSATGVGGAQMLWYSSANSINALASTTNLATGTYYVAQTINGCYSERRAVAVRVVSLAAPEVSSFTICESGTIADLYIVAASGVTFKWFNSPSSITELAQTEVLSTGTYFVSRVQYGCESARTPVQVNIESIPNAPTGLATQSFSEGATIASLIANQGNIVWYSTYNDSQTGLNPLATVMPLVNGATYYGVIIGTNGCPSLPFVVTVEVVLSNNDFVKDELKYYPNPVVDLFNISYSERIKQIEVFDILGKRVKTINTDNTDVQVDLSDLSSGTYMVQLRTETKSQFIKVVKK